MYHNDKILNTLLYKRVEESKLNNVLFTLAIGNDKEYPIKEFLHYPRKTNEYPRNEEDRYVKLLMEETPTIPNSEYCSPKDRMRFFILNYYSKSNGFWIKQAYLLNPTIELKDDVLTIFFSRIFEEIF